MADPSVPLIFQLSFFYFTMLGTFVGLAVGLVVSYLTDEPPLDRLDPKLFTPIIRSFLPKKQELKSHTEEYKLVSTEIPVEDEKETDLSNNTGDKSPET